jgi:quercetin dioxygenase-like cupin family protein
MRSAISASLFAFVLAAASLATAQDPIKADPKHYKVELENDQVRVLRVTYGAQEKSAMHEHPVGVAVAITDAVVKFTMADGKTEERRFKPGQAVWTPAEKHSPENVSDRPFEVVLIELKK